MPKIVINEQDLTTTPLRVTNNNVVFIPGFYGKDHGSVNDGAFLFCNNLSEFEEKVGVTAITATAAVSFAELTGDLTWTDIDSQYASPTTNFMDAGEADRSFMIAKELLNNGIPVLYYAKYATAIDADAIKALYAALHGTIPTSYEGGDITDSIFYKLRGLGDYAVKFLTTGGYPSFGFTVKEGKYNPIVDQMVRCSSRRGDCVALIDAYNNPDGDHKAFKDAINKYVSNTTANFFDITTGDPNGGTNYEYTHREHYGRSNNGNQGYVNSAYSTATMIYPWVDVTMSVGGFTEYKVPGSYAYLRALSQAVKQGNDWSAVAGVTRGQIPGFVRLCTNVPLTNTIADYMTPTDGVAVNAITNIRPYGEVIWGNRTLKDNAQVGISGATADLTATSFLNIRNAVSDIKKQVFEACNSLMFEPNSDVLWINFQSKIRPLLDRMKSSEIFSGYKIVHNTSKYPYKLLATIVVYPIYAVEEFEITVQLSNEELIIEG